MSAAPRSLARKSRLISVTIQPGAMALTRMPLKASSSASALVIWIDAGFGGGIGDDALGDAEAEHGGDIDDGAAACRPRACGAPLPARNRTRRRDRSPSTRRHSSSAISTARPECATPALLTRIVTVPKAFSAASNARCIAARSRTSASIATAGRRTFDPRFHGGKPIGPPRHQRDRRAVVRQNLGETHAEPARCAGHQRDLAGKAENVRCGHGTSLEKLSKFLRVVTASGAAL